MWPFVAAILSAMGMGGAGAAGAGAGLGASGLAAGSALTAPALMGMGAGTAGGLASTLAPAIGPTIGAAAALPAATNPGILATMFPGLTQVGKSAMGGDLSGVGGGVGKMAGSENLANMLSNPSWANFGKLGAGVGDKMALNMMTGGGGQPTPQEAVGPGAIQAKQQKSAAMPETDDPILKRMYQNLNPQQQNQFASGVTPMKPWAASPYPRKMSAI